MSRRRLKREIRSLLSAFVRRHALGQPTMTTRKLAENVGQLVLQVIVAHLREHPQSMTMGEVLILVAELDVEAEEIVEVALRSRP